MKNFAVIGLVLILPSLAFGQDGPSGKTLASTIDVYVFPKDAQDSAQQSTDEVQCYDWAVTNSGSDPFNLGKQEQAQQEQAQQEMAAAEDVGKGAAVGGAARGAAGGAVVGAIAGDAGKGAAYGAATGAVVSRRRGKKANAQAQGQAAQQAEVRQEATAEDLENFNKAFSVCLEAKDYMVKY